MKLLDIKSEFELLNNLIEEESEGVNPETGEFYSNEETIRELTKELQQHKDDMLDFLANKRSEYRAGEAFLQDEIKRLQDRKKTLQNQQNRLLETIDFVLEGSGNKTLNHTFYYAKSERVEILDEDNIPSDYIKFKREVNKSELKKALKVGEVEGAKLIENIGVRVR